MRGVPEELRYSENHTWVLDEDTKNIVTIGVTDYAQDKLGQIVYIRLPEVGAKISAGDEVCVLETTIMEEDIFSPVSGKVVSINEDLEEAPGLINSDPYQDGWLYKLELKDPVEYDELLDSESYNEYLQELEEED